MMAWLQISQIWRHLGIAPSPMTRATRRDLLGLDSMEPASQAASPSSYPLVGRDAEWAAMRSMWHAAAAWQNELHATLGRPVQPESEWPRPWHIPLEM